MDADSVETQMTAVREKLDDREDVTVFEIESQPYSGFEFRNTSLPEFLEGALALDVTEFYLLESRLEDDRIERAGLCYLYEGRLHARILEPHQEDQPEDTALGARHRTAGLREETEEERELKQELAEELLGEYNEYLTEEERFRLENKLERQPVSQLMRWQDRVEEEARVDPEEEKRLARAVVNDDRFNQQFNAMDTEMLLDELDIEYEEDAVRVDQVHRRAKSLLKINR